MDTPLLARTARRLRVEEGLTQTELARRMVENGYSANLSVQAISQAENDQIGTSMNALRVAIIEELTGRKLEGPVWYFEDESAD